MSGGRWNYQQWHDLAELPAQLDKLKRFAETIAQSEKIIDWAESGDTSRRREDGTGAEQDLYELWLKTFDDIYG